MEITELTDSTIAGPSSAHGDVPGYPLPAAQGCPFELDSEIRALSRTAPISRVRLWDGSTPWMVSGYKEVRSLLRDSRVSSSAYHPNYPHTTSTKFVQNLGFVVMDAPEHPRLRGLVARPFTPRRTEAMRPAIQRIVDGLIDDMLADSQPVDLVQAFALPVPSTVICQMLGVPYSDHEFFHRCTREMINPLGTRESSLAARDALSGYIDRLIEERRSTPEADLISDLIMHVEHGTLRNDEATLMAMMLLVAGFESTANMIAMGTLALLESPEQLAIFRALDEPEQVEQAVEELLRYVNITRTGRRRVAAADIEIGGHLIREGDAMILATELANWDETIFEEPDRLDVTKARHKHLAFGYGVHQCLGQSLARMELQVVFSTLFRRIPSLRLAVRSDQLRFKESLATIFGVNELLVTW